MPAFYTHVYRLFRISTLVLLLALNLGLSTRVQAAPSISTITDNRNSYPNSQVPKFEKLEITFEIGSTTATNFFFPFDPNPPPGIPRETGISVSAVFTDPEGHTFTQPGFYYQNFQAATKGSREWFYPTANYAWKVRFSPNQAGTWKYKITAQDSSGTSQSAETAFSVSDSGNKGFINVSARDPRYFEYDNGAYFPALGYNLSGGDLDHVNPVHGNRSKFRVMHANGIELSRVWISQFSMFGEAYGKWGSSNRVHLTQEPRYGIVNPINSTLTATFATYYPGQTPPALPAGSEYYMWLEFNKTLSADGSLPRFTPCRYFTNMAVKQNTNYRVRVRYRTVGLEGPLDPGKPFGFAIKRSADELHSPIDACNDSTRSGVTTIAASYNPSQVQNDPANPNWKFLEGTYNTGTNDFFGYLYLTFDNVKSTNADLVAGQVFIDQVWLEEASCNSQCANLVYKPDMDMHLYVNQRDAYSFDKLLDLSKEYGIYLKAVMLEKNDRILQTIDFNGQPTADQSTDNFYGNGTTVTKVRWLQQAWWRYMQARWGYSPNIHSWELINEGGPTPNHYIQADEFGKYMHCRVFGVEPVVDPTLGTICRLDHPNSHLVTTSFYGSLFPWIFWNNGGPAAAYKLYRDIDYADQHYYANLDDTGPLASYYDSALFSYKLSTTNNFSPLTRKPFIRGETAWGPPASTYFETNAEGGEWLHDFIWAGINRGGLMEQFYVTRQIYNPWGNPPHDHRPLFKTYYNFIKDVPLTNGQYRNAAASVSNPNLRAWGQKDLTNQRAHLWIANKNHTWKSVLDGVSVPPVSGTITLGGFHPNTSYKVEWWNTYAGRVNTTQTISTNVQGNLVLSVNHLVTDTAVKVAPGPVSENHVVTQLGLAPRTPNILTFNQNVTVSFSYQTIEPGGVLILARPFSGAVPTPNYAACPPPVYPAGTGTGTCTFTITSGAATVNRIRLQMWNASQTTLLFETFIPVHYQYKGNPTLVRTLILAPATPNILQFGQTVTVRFAYRTNQTGGVRIFARPMTGTGLTPNSPACPSPLYPAGTGTGTCSFTIQRGAATVDRIRFEIWNANLTTLLFRSFVPVHYQFQGGRTLVRSLSLRPLTPNLLLFGQNVTVSFNYRTDQAGGVRILAHPFTGGALTPNSSACGSPLYPVGTGTGTCSFTVNAGVITVNRIRFQVWNADQTVKLFEKFIPVHYQFH